jgi:uncharacterized protein
LKKLFSILFLLFTVAAFSQAHFDPDELLKPRTGVQTLVNDFTGSILTEDQRAALEQKLVAFNDSTSTQVAVVIIPTLNEKEISDYGVNLFRAWGIGTKAHNNGVLLLIAKDEHQLNITTGYGLEGALPDITCKEIIDDIIVPKFRGDDYYRGIDEGTDAILQAVRGVYTSPVSPDPPHKFPLIVRILFWIIGIIVLLILMKTGLLWPLLNIATSIVFSGGGSSGGGGFGGFGGGSSGGGGASGSW